jgi:hypothetical protein
MYMVEAAGFGDDSSTTSTFSACVGNRKQKLEIRRKEKVPLRDIVLNNEPRPQQSQQATSVPRPMTAFWMEIAQGTSASLSEAKHQGPVRLVAAVALRP